jgi:hypothetical protein
MTALRVSAINGKGEGGKGFAPPVFYFLLLLLLKRPPGCSLRQGLALPWKSSLRGALKRSPPP